MLYIKRLVFLVMASSVVFFIWLGLEQSEIADGDAVHYAQPGHTAPDFTLETAEGERLTLSENAGRHGTVLYFWTSWCPYCKASSQAVEKSHDTYGDNVQLIGVNVTNQDSVSEANHFINEQKLTFTQLMDSEGVVSSAYYVPPVPATIFIDAEGVVTKRKSGAISATELAQEIETLIEGGE